MSAVDVTTAKQHLNITVGTYDGELQAIIDSCEAAITKLVGPLVPTATTVQASGGSYCLSLSVTPALSLTSVTDNTGASVAIGDLWMTTSGIVEYTVSGTFPANWYTVVYQAGRTSLPADLRLAVLEMVRHKWSASQRGGTRRPGTAPSDALANTLPGSAYTFPTSVTELLAPHIQVGV